MNEKNDRIASDDEDESRDSGSWDNRILCSDGNCIGVIGPDGRCKECGKPYEGDLPEGFSQASGPSPQATPADADEIAEQETASPIAENATEDVAAVSPADATDSDWDSRILCSDGNCIGVIGPDGRCKECGKPYTPDSDE